jgi:riboflavin biosynthesis pyrimidine reductase
MALERLIDKTQDTDKPQDLYAQIRFPEPPTDRPYVYSNMVATVDGRIVLGDADGNALGVGEATDQLLFRRLQRQCDAAMLGATTVRSTPVIYPPEKPRFTVTRTGDIPLENRFFTDAPDRAYVLAPEDLDREAQARLCGQTHLLCFGQGEVDLTQAMRHLRQNMGIRHLLCEGGSVLNEKMLHLGLIDELFLTVTPKLKGGSHLPGILEGPGFPRHQYLPVSLLSLYHDNDEFYFRYRIGRDVRSISR